MSFVITEPMVRKLIDTVDAGLSQGLGEPVPGQMCVEAAISYALGEPHSDGPSCVDPIVRQAKIRLNDAAWSSPMARARGMRRVAIAQLGSKDTIDSLKFVTLLTEYVIREIVPLALRWAAKRWAAKGNQKHAVALEERAVQCERDGNKAAADAAADAAAYAAADAAARAARAAARAAAYAAYAAADAAARAARAAAYAAYAAAYAAYAADAADAEKDKILSLCAALMVRALQECGSPGCDWLWLVDEIPSPHERKNA